MQAAASAKPTCAAARACVRVYYQGTDLFISTLRSPQFLLGGHAWTHEFGPTDTTKSCTEKRKGC